jgi:MYXO-CTERM domain-containing protein
MRLLAALVLLAGCVGEPVDESSTEQEATTAFANDKAAFDFFIAKGLTPAQAAGIVGNLDQESGVDPTIAQYGGGPGRGIAQWSTGGRWDTSHNDNVIWYAGTQGESATSLKLQLEFIWYELTNIGYGYTHLRGTTNVTDATLAFMSDYEICGTCASSQRIAYANNVLAAYGNDAVLSASYVSQSWPLATTAMVIHCGERIDAQITLKNTGTKPWDGNTRLGTTMPRDRASIFASDDWVSPDRPAAIDGTVAPGADGTFKFTFQGPTGDACVPGIYHEHFGVVQESVGWFTDPPDDQLEAQIQLVPADPSAPGDPGNPGSTTETPANSAGCSTGGGGGASGALLALGMLVARRRRAA